MTTHLDPNFYTQGRSRMLQKIVANQRLGKYFTLDLFSRRRLVTWRSFQAKFQLYTGERLPWTKVISRLSGTVIQAIWPWVALCAAYSLVLSLLNQYNYLTTFQQIKALPQITVPLNLVLSLLLAFRTNAAHDRFWEARKLWGAMGNTIRNLARGICITIEEKAESDRLHKEAVMRLVSSFAVAMKLHLRREDINRDNELDTLMPAVQYARIQQVNHAPLEIAFWIGDYLQHQYQRECLNVFQLQDLHRMLNMMVDILGGCERILKTPVPLIYTITLKFLFITYFILVPLQMVETLQWWTTPITAFVSFIYLAIHEIGSEIEEPFGSDPNDLPLDFICHTIQHNVEDLIQQAPMSRCIAAWPRVGRSQM